LVNTGELRTDNLRGGIRKCTANKLEYTRLIMCIIMYYNTVGLMIILAIITYLSRMAGGEFMAGRALSPTLRSYSNYVPVAVISALVMKQMIVPGAGVANISLPVLGACLAIAIGLKLTRAFLPSAIIGVATGLLLRIFY